ncbi:MAG: hypothetical protein AABM67_04905 [Acidobacteriota bacterium]
MHTFGRYCIISVIISCVLFTACSRPPTPVGPKFTGRLLLLAGDNPNGADLIELTAAPTGSGYTHAVVTSGVFEAVASPDRTQLLYTTRDELLLRDLGSGAVKPLLKGKNFCIDWAPDGNHFSLKQNAANSETRLLVSDLEGKTKSIWDDPYAHFGTSTTGKSSGAARAAGTFGCARWLAPDRLIFDRFIGGVGKQKPGSEVLKPNTTTLATVSGVVKLTDSDKKWLIEGICQVGSAIFLRAQDQSQILIAKTIDNLKTLNPKPGPCSGCRFAGFAAKSCVPFFIEDSSSTSSELFYLNPTNWERQRAAHIGQTFSVSARMLINSAARLMVVGDVPASLLLVDTETGEIAPFFPKAGVPGASDERFTSPVPVVWIEK